MSVINPDLDPNETNPYTLWAEIIRLREAMQGPDGFATWYDAAVAERIKRVRAEKQLSETRRFKQQPSAFRLVWPAEYSIGQQTYYTNNDSPRMQRAIEFAPEEYKPKVISLYEIESDLPQNEI